MLHPIQARACRVVAFNGDHVETAGLFGPARLFVEEVLCGEDQAVAFARVDTFECAAPLPMLAIAYFGEYYCIAIKHDQIEFTTAAPPVLRQQLQTVLAQVRQRGGFGLAAGA